MSKMKKIKNKIKSRYWEKKLKKEQKNKKNNFKA